MGALRTHLQRLDELNGLLDQLDAEAPYDAEPGERYWEIHDAVLDLVERCPELADAARAYGLPV